MELRRMLVTNRYTPLYLSPSNRSIKLCDLLSGTIVWYNNDTNIKNTEGLWTEILYRTNSKEYIGWVKSYFLEKFVPSIIGYDVIKIKNPSESDSDLVQYLKYNGTFNFNWCGQFCVAYCAEYDGYIEDWVDSWKTIKPKLWNTVFSKGMGRTTGLTDLNQMLNSFEGYPDKFELASDRFKYDSYYLFTPYKLMDVLRTNRIIVGCKISTSQYGELSSSGVAHWIVLESCTPEERGAICHIYNPSSNSVRTADWRTIIDSVGKVPYGLVIPR